MSCIFPKHIGNLIYRELFEVLLYYVYYAYADGFSGRKVGQVL